MRREKRISPTVPQQRISPSAAGAGAEASCDGQGGWGMLSGRCVAAFHQEKHLGWGRGESLPRNEAQREIPETQQQAGPRYLCVLTLPVCCVVVPPLSPVSIFHTQFLPSLSTLQFFLNPKPSPSSEFLLFPAGTRYE